MKHVSKALLVLPVFLLLLPAACGEKGTGGKENPFEYDISEYRKVDPTLIKYKEIQPLRPGMETLHAVAVGPDDTIYVAGDTGLAIFNNERNPVSRFPLGAAATCVHVTEAGDIYVGKKDHVEVFTADGTRKSSWETLGENAFITSIAAVGSDVYVADAGNRLVLHCDAAGKILGRIGRKDPARSYPGLIVPSPYLDVAIGYEGYVWAVNPGLHQLENYTPDGSLRSSWRRDGMTIDGFSGCCNPTHMAILPDGSFVTSEKGLERVKVHGPTGDLIAVVAGPEQFKEGVVGLDLAVDSNGRIFVLDPSLGSVRIFVKKNATKTPRHQVSLKKFLIGEPLCLGVLVAKNQEV